MTRPQPTWRSLLFVPVTSERFVSKAHTRGADAIILDLEDSILPAHKAAARAALPATVPRVAQGGADVVVRINRPLDLAVADIATSVMPDVAALMLPKVMGPEHVRLLAELVTEREAALGMPIGHTRFLALIESPAALPHLFAIAAEPRMAGMSVGGEDMATELGAIPSADSMYVFAKAPQRAQRASCRWGRWASSRRSTTSNPTERGCGAAGRWASPRPPASTRRTCRSSTKSTARRRPSWTARAG
jgi:citrate lyase subunit beta/citryl-CoA lyase